MRILLKDGTGIETGALLNYAQYLQAIEKMVLQNSSSGNEVTEEKIQATRLNLQRMKRLDRNFAPDRHLVDKARRLKQPVAWIVITEAWCGDSAQILPILNKLSLLSEGKISLHFVFRDMAPHLMDHFLTGSSRSIPKLICADAASGDVLDTWGPRPSAIAEWFSKFRESFPDLPKSELHYKLQLIYSRDKGESLQKDIAVLIERCKADHRQALDA